MWEPAEAACPLAPGRGHTHTQCKEALLSLESQTRLELGRCLPPERLQVPIIELGLFPNCSVS